MQNLVDIIAEFSRQPLPYWPRLEPHHVSFELDGGRVMKRCADMATELIRICDLQSWGFPDTDDSTISVREIDRTFIVADHHGTLRRILQRVAANRLSQY
jgi:hypothetical protein